MKVVALVGCPNVGKSTLFNRLTKTRDALVADFPGLTRDRKYGRAIFDGREYIVVDTGGISDDKEQPHDLTSRMTNQALQAIAECDLVLFMVDARAGLVTGDLQVAEFIRRSHKPCALVVNKIDGLDPDIAGTEFYSLGLGEIHQIAAAHGRGVTSLVEDVIAPILREEGPLDSDPKPEDLEKEEEEDFSDFDVDVSRLYEDVEADEASSLSDEELAQIVASEDNFKDDEQDTQEDGSSEDADEDAEAYDLEDEDLEDEAFAAEFGDDQEIASEQKTEGKKRYSKEKSQWEQGYEFLENVPLDVTGGGFNWHEFREAKRAREKGGEGATNLTDEQKAALKEQEKRWADRPFADLPIKFALVGKPNVGKSTLTNRLLGEDRVVVCDMPGTTRDSIYIPLERGDHKYIVIDTAGVRRRKKVSEAIEKFSIVKTLKAIEDANVVILVIDAREHITDQDLSLLGFIIDSGRSLVVAVNKWDGLTTDFKDEIRRELDLRLGFVDFARVHFISALHGTGVGNLFDSINEAYESATRRNSSSTLNRILQAAVQEHEPPISGGRRIKLKYAHAGGYNPPRIIIHGNKVNKLPDSYKRYIINCYRKALKIMGTPIILEFKEGTNPFANEKPAQKRLTQSKMRELRRKEQNERMWAHAAKKREKELARAKEKGAREGMVLRAGKASSKKR